MSGNWIPAFAGVTYEGTSEMLHQFQPWSCSIQKRFSSYQADSILCSLSFNYHLIKYNINDYDWANVPLVAFGSVYMGASQNDYIAQAVSLGADYKF